MLEQLRRGESEQSTLSALSRRDSVDVPGHCSLLLCGVPSRPISGSPQLHGIEVAQARRPAFKGLQFSNAL